MSMSPLIKAVFTGNLKEVKRLIKNGANVDEKSSVVGGTEVTPLIFASKLEEISIVKHLIKSGADVNIKAKGEQGDVSSLQVALSSDNLPLIKVLVKAGADVNEDISAPVGDISPLHFASVYASLEVVKLLVDAGADPTVKASKVGVKARDLARLNNKGDIEKYLIKAEEEFVSNQEDSYMFDENVEIVHTASGETTNFVVGELNSTETIDQ